jgi:hypothetical protein
LALIRLLGSRLLDEPRQELDDLGITGVSGIEFFVSERIVSETVRSAVLDFLVFGSCNASIENGVRAIHQ